MTTIFCECPEALVYAGCPITCTTNVALVNLILLMISAYCYIITQQKYLHDKFERSCLFDQLYKFKKKGVTHFLTRQSVIQFWQDNLSFSSDKTICHSVLTRQSVIRFWQHNLSFSSDKTICHSVLTTQSVIQFWQHNLSFSSDNIICHSVMTPQSVIQLWQHNLSFSYEYMFTRKYLVISHCNFTPWYASPRCLVKYV